MVSKRDLTVLNDYTNEGKSHREAAADLLPALKEEMSEEEWEADFMMDLREAVVTEILRDLEANLLHEDWYGMGFESPEDLLDADAVSDAIGETCKWYFDDDQIGKSWEVLTVILEYAEEHDLVKRKNG